MLSRNTPLFVASRRRDGHSDGRESGFLAGRFNVNREEVVKKLKDHYDGYHFTWPSPDIYNPFSLLNAFADGQFGLYWFGSGIPPHRNAEQIDVLPSRIGGNEAVAADFECTDRTDAASLPLLYQSSHHHRGYDEMFQIYMYRTSRMPGSEDRPDAQPHTLLCDTRHADDQHHGGPTGPPAGTQRHGRDAPPVDVFQHALFATARTTKAQQQMLYIIFSLLGAYVDVKYVPQWDGWT